MTDDERQTYVIGLVNQINSVLAGEPMAEAQTALVMTVVCEIVSCEPGDPAKRAEMARNFTGILDGFLQREDIVDWIKHHTIQPTPGQSRRRQ